MKYWRTCLLLYGFGFVFGGGLCFTVSNNKMYFLIMIVLGFIFLFLSMYKRKVK